MEVTNVRFTLFLQEGEIDSQIRTFLLSIHDFLIRKKKKDIYKKEPHRKLSLHSL